MIIRSFESRALVKSFAKFMCQPCLVGLAAQYWVELSDAGQLRRWLGRLVEVEAVEWTRGLLLEALDVYRPIEFGARFCRRESSDSD